MYAFLVLGLMVVTSLVFWGLIGWAVIELIELMKGVLT